MADVVTPMWEPDQTRWRDRPVFVTGAHGFLGSHLTGRLADLGADVVVLVRDERPPTSVTAAWEDRVIAVRGDLRDEELLERVLVEHEIASVFHLGAQTQVGVANTNALSTWESNVRGTWCLLEAARRSPTLQQVVVASSDKAYGAQPELPYAEDMPFLAVHPYDVSKACTDLISFSYHEVFGLPVSVTRCGNFFGPGDTNWQRLVPGTIRSVVRGERPVIRSDGTLVRDYLYVDDGALAYLCLAEAMWTKPAAVGHAFNFSTEVQLTVLEITRRILDAMGSDLEPDVQDTARHEIPHQYLSAARAHDILGWQPRYSVDEAIALTVEWYRTELASTG